MSLDAQHVPVLLNEVIEQLVIRPNGVYLDCTGGLGGHSQAILDRLGPGGKLIVCDYFSEAVDGLKTKFQNDQRVQVKHSRFSQVFDNLNFSFDGILADFGISSAQLDHPELGISFLGESVFLDMRLDASLSVTAAEILKTWSEEDLADLFFHKGGETGSRRLARAIVHDRKEGTFYEMTHDLRDLCARVLGRFYRKKKIHAATKVFQALRIAVNKELDEVETLLGKAPGVLNSGGRLVLISFHSGEDRLVKTVFRELAMKDGYSLPTRKAIKPTSDEILENVRARSARLRVLKRDEEVL